VNRLYTAVDPKRQPLVFGHKKPSRVKLRLTIRHGSDWMERRARDGRHQTVPNREHIQRSRLRYDARRWLLSNALPKLYGNRVAAEAKDEASNPWAEFIKLVNGKTRGLPSEDQPVDQRELEEFERKLQKMAGPPADRL
jgi:hypothetical protein